MEITIQNDTQWSLPREPPGNLPLRGSAGEVGAVAELLSTEPVSASVSRTQRSSLKAFPVCLRPHSCLALPMPVALGAPDKSVVLSSFLVNNSVGQRAGQAWGQSKRFTDVWLAARRQIGAVSTAGKGTWWLLWHSLTERYFPLWDTCASGSAAGWHPYAAPFLPQLPVPHQSYRK